MMLAQIHRGHRDSGFTLIEIVIAVLILGFLITTVSIVAGRTITRSANVTTLSEMDGIKKTIRDRFYTDIGYIPEDTAEPEYATRYLCLVNDGAGNPEYQEMLGFVGNAELMSWNKHVRRGWKAPYMERDASYFDAADNQWYPVLTDSWGTFYYILANAVQDKASARIVSLGADGIDNGGTVFPVPADIGDDIVMFIFGRGETRSPL